MEPIAISHFCASLRTRNSSPHTIEHYGRDLRLFFAPLDPDPWTVSWREVDACIQQHHTAQCAATTINRRLHAVKHFCASLVMERQTLASHPVKPSHCLRRGRPLPQQLSQDPVRTLCAHLAHPMDHALGVLMLRCGVRVSEVARLTLDAIDWEQSSLWIERGQGRQDRLVSVSTDALAALRTCVAARPASVPDGVVFWHQKRPHRALSSKGIQKKRERYAKAAGVKASCHNLRHTFASNLLEAGAEVSASKALRGHASIESSERDALASAGEAGLPADAPHSDCPHTGVKTRRGGVWSP